MAYGKYDFNTELDGFGDSFETEFEHYWWLDSETAPDGVDPDAWRSMFEARDLANKITAIARSLLRRKGIGTARLQEGRHLAEEAKRMQLAVSQMLEQASKMEGLSAEERAQLALAFKSPGGIGDPRAKHLVFH